MIRVLSIDASTRCTGYAVFEIAEDSSFKKIDGGTINPTLLEDYRARFTRKTKSVVQLSKTEAKRLQSEKKSRAMEYRCRYMIKALCELCARFRIEVIVMEDTYASVDLNSYKWLSRLQGAVLGYCEGINGRVVFYAPSHWRSLLDIPITENGKRLQREALKKLSCKKYKECFEDEVSEDEAEASLMGLAFILNY